MFGAKKERERQQLLQRLLYDKFQERPKYAVPEEYGKILDIYKRRADKPIGSMPGEELFRSDIGRATSRGISDVSKYASTPSMALAAATDIYGREMEQIRDLSVRQQEYQQNQEMLKRADYDQLAQAYQLGGQYKDTEWNLNELQPWQLEMNMLEREKYESSQREQAAKQMTSQLFGGLFRIGTAAATGGFG